MDVKYTRKEKKQKGILNPFLGEWENTTKSPGRFSWGKGEGEENSMNLPLFQVQVDE